MEVKKKRSSKSFSSACVAVLNIYRKIVRNRAQNVLAVKNNFLLDANVRPSSKPAPAAQIYNPISFPFPVCKRVAIGSL